MDPDILDNPQYINSNGDLLSTPGKQNTTDVVVNVVEYEHEDEGEEKDDGINLDDYFQAIIDTDSLSLGMDDSIFLESAIQGGYRRMASL